MAFKPRLVYRPERVAVGWDVTPMFYPLNKQIQEDLNGDGVKERITVVTTPETGEINGVILKINNLEIDYGLNYGDNLVNGFAIIDIDIDDNFKEVVISNMVPGGDDTSKFYAFDGKKIIYMNEGANTTRPMLEEVKKWAFMDEISGLYNYIHNGLYGRITTLRRVSILQTWWYPIRYELTDGHLLRAVPEIFKVHYDAFALRDMPLYKNRSDKSPALQMKKGWFKVTGFNSLNINGEEIEAHNVFFNLYQAG